MNKFISNIYNWLLLLLSIMTALGLCEGAVRLAYPSLANYNTESWRYFSQFKELRDDPKLPFTMRPNQRAQIYGVELSTNSMGLRDSEIEESRTGDAARILVVGDSQTFGGV